MKRMSKNPPKEADDTKARGNYESVEQSALEDVAADDAKEVASTDDDEETGKRNICETCCEPKMRTLLTTHVNVFLYATCFWIQIGVLPVSISWFRFIRRSPTLTVSKEELLARQSRPLDTLCGHFPVNTRK